LRNQGNSIKYKYPRGITLIEEPIPSRHNNNNNRIYKRERNRIIYKEINISAAYAPNFYVHLSSPGP
jgi:hypothetical protein